MRFEPHELAVYRLRGLSPDDGRAICDAARAKAGSRYTTWEAVLSTFLRVFKLKALGQNQYCSRLVAQAYRDHGFILHGNPDHCFPSDLVRGEDWELILNGIRPWTVHDQHLYDSTPDVLADEGKSVFAWLRPLDWIALVTFHGRVRDADHAWHVVSESRFMDFFSARLLRKSGWFNAARSDTLVNPHRYDLQRFRSYLARAPMSERMDFLHAEWTVAVEMSGMILHNLDYYSPLGNARTICLMRDYEYSRLQTLIERVDVLLRVMLSDAVPAPGHPAHPDVATFLADLQAFASRRPI